MNRRLFEEVIESNRLRKIRLISFLCLILTHTLLFAQVERNSEKIFLNGFGRYIFIDNQLKLYNLFSYDVDGDGNIDIGGLDESGKNLHIYFGKGFNQFTRPVKYSLGYKFSGLIVKKLNLDSRPNLILSSKVDGLIKIYAFNRRSISLLMNLKVDCCFSDMNIINLDRGHALEIVLSGSNFRGLGIISFKNYTYTYTKIDNETYSKLIPIFLNSDEKIDFVGFNSLTKELVLIRNNSIYHYSKNVFKKFDEAIDEISSGNFDDDPINDLILVSNQTKLMYVLSGNGIGSFSNVRRMTTISNYSSITVSDYNRDLIDDFIVYDKFARKLFLKYFSNDQKRLINQTLIELNKLYSMANYRTTTTKGIAISSDQGLFLIVYSSLHFTSEKFALSSKISDLITLRLEDELFPRIIFIDNENRKLNILSRNEFNSPQEILVLPLSYPYERIKVLSFEGNEATLVAFKPLLYHFDFFKINLKTGIYLREILTVDGLIRDIGLEELTGNQIKINIITQVKDDLRMVILKPFDVNKAILNEKISSVNLIDFVFDYPKRELIYLSRGSRTNEIQLSIKKFNNSYKTSETVNLISIKNENYLSINLSMCDLIDGISYAYINLSSQLENKLMVVPLNKPDKFFTLEKVHINDVNSCKCKMHTSFPAKTFTFYNELNTNVEKIVFRSGRPVNYSLKSLPFNPIYSYDYSLKRKPEILYISDYSIINIEWSTE